MELREKHFLHPSALFASSKPHHVTTILGTCVSVCLWDQHRKAGGINHYMLPFWNGEGLASPKYGNIAIDKLVERMLRDGSNPKHIVAKVFGGKEENSEDGFFKIGERNAEIALKTLRQMNIPVIASSLGGLSGRKIQFFSDTGEVFMNFIKISV